jgi:hypothetical protein
METGHHPQTPGGSRNPSTGEDQQRKRKGTNMTCPDEPIDLTPVDPQVNELLDRAEAAPESGIADVNNAGQPSYNTLAEPVTITGEIGTAEDVADLTFGTDPIA